MTKKISNGMRKSNFKKMFAVAVFFVVIGVVGALNTSLTKAVSDLSCVQVITPAQNSTTGECKDFPTPCDVPVGWSKVDSCSILPKTLTITTTSLPSGTVGVAYTASLSATGGSEFYTWSATGLPAGLSIASGACIANTDLITAPCQAPGAISGTPTTTGTYTATVALTSGDQKVSKQFSLVIVAVNTSVLTITTSSPLPNGQVNSSYSAQVSASGGTGSYDWRISSGSLPSGLSLITAQCFTAPCQTPVTISGTPATAGTYAFTVEVSSSPLVGYGPTLMAEKQFSLVIASSVSSGPTITTSSLSSGTVGVTYRATLSATGGSDSYMWSATGLPAGLSAAGGACTAITVPCMAPGEILGTPTTAGTYIVTVTLTSGDQKVSKQFSLVISAANTSYITVLSPNGGEVWAKGTKQTIKWQDITPMPTCPIGATCVPQLKSYDIKLNEYYPPCTEKICPAYPYTAPYTIAKNIPNNYYSWTVGEIQGLYDALAPEGSYTIQICKTGSTTCDSSDSYFKIAAVGTPPQVCKALICEAGANPYDTGRVDASGCKIYSCPLRACAAPVCDGGNLVDTGKVDANGCKIYSCQEIDSSFISEQVKCWFKGSQTEQKCYMAGVYSVNENTSCSGKESCVMDVKRPKGEKITWKSSCGGYAYTTMDGTGGYDGRGEYAEFNCVPAATTVTTTPVSTESKVEIIDMQYSAKNMVDNKYDSILSELKQLRDTVKEQQTEIKYLKSMTNDLRNISEAMKGAINDFITYGVDANTVKLGAGERAAVINSYKAAFAKLPETEAELTDAIKIANGRFPSLVSDKAETAAKEQFIKIYKRIPDLNDPKDNAAIKVMAYGLRQKAANRNLNSEKSGIKTFKAIYGWTPKTTQDWNTMQAITYSGAAREKDSDGDLLSDEMEAKYGTDPNKADTDGDGFKDGVEVNGGFNPKGEGKI